MAIIPEAWQEIVKNSTNTIKNYSGSVTVANASSTVWVMIHGYTNLSSDSAGVSVLTLDGNAMTVVVLGGGQTNNRSWSAIAYIHNPATGSLTLNLTTNNNQRAMEISAIELPGTDQTTPVADSGVVGGTSTTTTVGFTDTPDTVGQFYLSAVAVDGGETGRIPTVSGATLLNANHTGTSSFSDVSYADAIDEVTSIAADGHDYNWSGSENRGLSWVLINATPSNGNTLTASGTSTVTMLGQAVKQATVAASGTSTVTMLGQAVKQATGTAAGTSTVTMLGGQIKQATATIAGTSTVTMLGQAVKQATVTIAGISSGTMLGQAVKQATVTIAGTSTVNPLDGTSGATNRTLTAAGTSTVTMLGQAVKQATGTAAGTSTVTMLGQAVKQATATAAGTSTVTMLGQSVKQATATIAGTSTVTMLGGQIKQATVTIAGTSTVNPLNGGTPAGSKTLTAAGTSTVTMLGQAVKQATATAAGTSTVTMLGQAVKQATVTIAGTGSVTVLGGQIKQATVVITGVSTATFETRVRWRASPQNSKTAIRLAPSLRELTIADSVRQITLKEA